MIPSYASPLPVRRDPIPSPKAHQPPSPLLGYPYSPVRRSPGEGGALPYSPPLHSPPIPPHYASHLKSKTFVHPDLLPPPCHPGSGSGVAPEQEKKCIGVISRIDGRDALWRRPPRSRVEAPAGLARISRRPVRNAPLRGRDLYLPACLLPKPRQRRKPETPPSARGGMAASTNRCPAAHGAEE